jgi:heavy metal translocating P-type ATPase
MTAAPASTAACTYCGLPLPRPLFGRRAVVAEGPQYCCSGCRIAHAVTREQGEAGAASWAITCLGLALFFSMSVMAFTFALWSFDVYRPATEGNLALPAAYADLLRWLCLLFTVPVVLLLGWPLAIDAWQDLRRGAWSADLLLLTGVVAACGYSTWSVWNGSGAVYFETACVILVFVTFGRWLGASGRLKTTAALDALQRLLPEEVRRIGSAGVATVPLDALQIGDVIVVQAGERLAVDGVVILGTAAVDEQVFTGESVPVTRSAGDAVFAGTLSLDGTIHVGATQRPRGGAFGALLEAVRAARESKGRYQTAADRMTRCFFPIITAVAAATVIGHGLTRGWAAGWLAGLSVVLIACPCALALATPLAVWSALGRAARAGVLFRSGEAIERLAEVCVVAFDKTGTLTTGTPQVAAVVLSQGTDAAEVRRRASRLAGESQHVFSRAISAHWGSDLNDDAADGSHTRTVAGCGMELVDPAGDVARLGAWDWLRRKGVEADVSLTRAHAAACRAGHSVVALAWGGAIRALVMLTESLRGEASDTVRQLRSQGLRLVILTGDHAQPAESVAHAVGVEAISSLSPGAKGSEITRWRKLYGPVAMVGDGINDSPALAAADVGIALGCGTDVTRDSAAVCLLGDDLTRIAWAMDLARETVRTIRGNLAWAFGYNFVGVALAAAGWLHPAVAAVLMAVSSGVVVARSRRLGLDDAPAIRKPAGSGVSPLLDASPPREIAAATPSAPAEVVP